LWAVHILRGDDPFGFVVGVSLESVVFDPRGNCNFTVKIVLVADENNRKKECYFFGVIDRTYFIEAIKSAVQIRI
jgi:hypothetical protein